VLDVPVQFFFGEMSPDTVTAMRHIQQSQGLTPPPAPAFEAEPMARRETLELVRAYYRISDPAVRRRLFELAKALAPAEPEDGPHN
jgi:hypothetical protein